MSRSVPAERIRAVRTGDAEGSGSWVLYWMTSCRRVDWSFSFDRAVEWAERLRKPLLVLEALRVGYPWASDRLHAFVLEGMRDNAARLAGTGVGYYPYLERTAGEGKGLFETLARDAAVVVTDDSPAFFLPRMLEAASRQCSVRMEAVDGNGLLPLRAADKVFARAVDFRRFLQRELPHRFEELPRPDPLAGVELAPFAEERLSEIESSWPRLSRAALQKPLALLPALPIDHAVAPASLSGGARAGSARLQSFLDEDLVDYAVRRNDPDADASSGLSPYLHFGHVSAHQVYAELCAREEWTPLAIVGPGRGQRAGWWGMSEAAEAFLDQLITWRELGFNMSWQRADAEELTSLPEWARRTIDDHRDDERPEVYTPEQLERAETGDELWNAAQRQLLLEGRMHGYLRMLWGKKIYQWSEQPEEALATMLHLNNKYALDGRDPNSTSGILWCLGRYDRPWGPERPIFGKLRYMTSESARRKLRLESYLRRYGQKAGQSSLFETVER